MGMTNLGKSKIIVDTTVLDNGDSIAAYLTSAAGTLISSSVVGAKNALDTKGVADYATNAASVAADNGTLGLAVRHDANTTIATANGNYAPLQLDANGNLKISGTIVVTDAAEYAEDSPANNADIGIMTLLVRQDTLASSTSADGDYGTFKSTNLGELYVKDVSAIAQLVTANSNLSTIITNTGNSATSNASTAAVLTALSKAEDAPHVSGDQGIQALAVRKDASGSNVNADGDYASLITWSNGALKVVDIANASLLQQSVSVAATATAIPATPLAGRQSLMIQNAGAASIWVGTGTVTSSGATRGIEVPKGGFIELDVGPAVAVSAITAAGSISVNVLETA